MNTIESRASALSAIFTVYADSNVPAEHKQEPASRSTDINCCLKGTPLALSRQFLTEELLDRGYMPIATSSQEIISAFVGMRDNIATDQIDAAQAATVVAGQIRDEGESALSSQQRPDSGVVLKLLE